MNTSISISIEEEKKTRREVNYIPDDTITSFTEKFLNLISIVNVEQTVRHDKAMRGHIPRCVDTRECINETGRVKRLHDIYTHIYK